MMYRIFKLLIEVLYYAELNFPRVLLSLSSHTVLWFFILCFKNLTSISSLLGKPVCAQQGMLLECVFEVKKIENKVMLAVQTKLQPNIQIKDFTGYLTVKCSLRNAV